MARHFGSVFVLALVQRFEARASYDDEADATPTMAADEQIHEEVIRALAARGRDRLSGSFRAAVFGANDGLVSNLALIMGVSASGVANQTVLVTGLAGLLAGALSMGAGEYVSVSSQRELLEASAPSPNVGAALTQLDVNANELELVYRARGMSASEATAHAAEVLANRAGSAPTAQIADGDTVHRVPGAEADRHEAVGTGLKAAVSSFLFFAVGALIPVLPYLFGLDRSDRRRGRRGAGRCHAAGDRRDRRAALRGATTAAGDAPVADRLRRRGESPICWACSSAPGWADRLPALTCGIALLQRPRGTNPDSPRLGLVTLE